MRNLIKADLYRIVRGKALYIGMVLVLLLIVMNTVSMARMNLTVGSAEDIAAAQTAQKATNEYVADHLNAIVGVQGIMQNTETLAIIFLIFIYAVVGSDFRSGAVRNIIASGLSRGRYYLAKFSLTTGICLAALALMLLVAFITGGIRGGFGGMGLFGQDATGVLLACLLQVGMVVALVAMGVGVAMATRSGKVLILVYLLFWMLPPFIIGFISGFTDSDTSWLTEWLYYSNLSSLMFGISGEGVDVARCGTMALALFALCTAGGLAVFNRAEVK